MNLSPRLKKVETTPKWLNLLPLKSPSTVLGVGRLHRQVMVRAAPGGGFLGMAFAADRGADMGRRGDRCDQRCAGRSAGNMGRCRLTAGLATQQRQRQATHQD